MTVLARNNQAGPTVFTDANSKTQIEWQGSGHADGEDIQMVPAEVVENPQFQKAINRGVLSIVEADDQTKALLDRQAQTFQERQAASAQSSIEVLDRKADNDIVALPCIGPNPKGTGECGQNSLVRRAQVTERPPLCSLHETLSSQFVMAETDRIVDGKAEVRWSRVTIDPR